MSSVVEASHLHLGADAFGTPYQMGVWIWNPRRPSHFNLNGWVWFSLPWKSTCNMIAVQSWTELRPVEHTYTPSGAPACNSVMQAAFSVSTPAH